MVPCPRDGPKHHANAQLSPNKGPLCPGGGALKEPEKIFRRPKGPKKFYPIASGDLGGGWADGGSEEREQWSILIA